MDLIGRSYLQHKKQETPPPFVRVSRFSGLFTGPDFPFSFIRLFLLCLLHMKVTGGIYHSKFLNR